MKHQMVMPAAMITRAALAIREAGDGNAQKRVKHRERQSDQQAHLRVGDLQVAATGSISSAMIWRSTKETV